MLNCEAKHQKYKGRVVLRGDIVKDDSGSHAVFIEQGSSAFQMTAAKIMDIISRLPGCRRTSSRRSNQLIPKWKWKMLTNYWKFPNRSVQTFGFVHHDKWPKSWSSMEDPVVPVERNLYGHPLAGPLWERQFEKILLKHGWEKIPNCECLFVHREKGLFLSVYVDDKKLGCKETKSWSDVETTQQRSRFVRNQHLSCIMYTWDALKRQCEISKDIVDNYRAMFESRVSAGETEKLSYFENFCISSWSYDMEGHAKKCVERYCELANKSTQQLYKISTPCIDDHHFKEEEMKSVGELSQVCSQIVLKMLILGTYWTTLYSTVSEQTCTIDYEMEQSLWTNDWIVWCLTSITHVNTDNIVIWVILLNNADWDCFKTLWFRGRSWRFEIHLWRNIVHFWTSYICSNKLDVQETNCRFAQFKQNLRSSLWTLDWDWMVCLLWNYGI